MSSLLERADLDRISEDAQEVRIARALLTILAAALYLVGWTAAKVVIVLLIAFRVAALALAWVFAALRLGWQDAWAASSQRRTRRAVGSA